MEPQQEQIRDQQKQSWNKFSPGWKKWNELLMQFLKPMGDASIAQLHITDGDKVLDIAAGTGEPGLTIAKLTGNGEVTGTDLSDEMLRIARENAEAMGLKNYGTRVADVCALPFEDNTFDAVSCRMGFMYFPDMQLAADEMYRVLKPGGRLSASVWAAPDLNFWITALMSVVNKYVSLPPPPPGGLGMFRCAAPGSIAGVLRQSGFKNIKDESVQGKGDYVDAETYWAHMVDCAAPVMAVVNQADEETKTTIRNEVHELIRGSSTNGRALLDFGATVTYGEK